MWKCVCDFNDATNTKEEIRKSFSLSGSMLAGMTFKKCNDPKC